MKTSDSNTAEREIVIIRVFNALRELVFQADCRVRAGQGLRRDGR